MDKYLFMVRDHNGDHINTYEVQQPDRLMRTAHGLIDAYHCLGAEYCEIWMRTDHSKMILLGTAF